MATANEIEVADDETTRVRRPADFGLLATLGLVLALLVVLGMTAEGTTHGANSDLARLVDHLPAALTRVLSYLGSVGVLAMPIGYLIELIVRREPRRLLEAVATGIVSLAVCTALGSAVHAARHSALYASLSSSHHGAVTVLDSYLAAIAAFAALGGVSRRRPWRDLYAAAVVIYLIAAIAAAQATVLALAASYVIGALIGVGARIALGSADARPDAAAIGAALSARGLRVASLARRPDPGADRRYEATTTSGRRLDVLVLDRASIPSGSLYRVYRLIRVRREVSRPPAVSLERAAERRSLLSLSAEHAGAPVPHLVCGVACGPDAIALAYESASATPVTQAMSPPEEDALLRLWREISTMHDRGVTHGSLTTSCLLIGSDGRIRLRSPVDGTAFASSLRISLDRADLLVTTAMLVGPAAAVKIADESIGQPGLVATRRVLQPVALSRESRLALRRDKTLISKLQDEIDERLPRSATPSADLERVRPRTVLTLVGLIIAGYLLLGQLGSVDLATVFSNVNWLWLPAVLALSALSYVAAAMTLTGLVRERLMFGRTVLAQVAASFVGFVTPPAVGGAATNVQYLRKAGLPAAGAATSVAVNQVLNAGAHIVLLVLVAAATGSSTHDRLPIPGWAFVAVGLIAVAAIVVFAIPRGRRWLLARIMPTVREAGPRLLDMLTRPSRLAMSLGGTLLLSAANIGALVTAVYALGASATVGAVALVYLVGAALGSASPTPGGLGAVEAALSAGLAATGIPGATAVSAVLLFRVATFWLPVPAGWLAVHLLQRRDLL